MRSLLILFAAWLAMVVLAAMLTGCGTALPALMYIGSAVTIAKDVLDIDVSLSQQTPGRTPIVK